jgi:hypothetical protein
MLPVEKTTKLLQRPGNLIAPFQPGPVDAIAGAIDIATPDALQAHQDAAFPSRGDLLELVREPNGRSPVEPYNRPVIPHVVRPFRRRVEADLVTGLGHTGGQSLQIRLRAAAGRKPAPDKSYGKLVGSHLRDMETLLGSNRHNTC